MLRVEALELEAKRATIVGKKSKHRQTRWEDQLWHMQYLSIVVL